MSNTYHVRDLISSTRKGITPKYVEKSNILVINQRCIRNNAIDFSFARYHDQEKTFAKDKIIKIGDILINSTGQGTAGRCAFVKELPTNKVVITDSHVLIVRVNNFYTAGCLGYLLFSIEGLLQTFMDGSTGQGEFDKERLLNIIAELPPKEQREIVFKLLSDLDKKIEINNRINAELEAIAKTLYDYWFVQFDFPDANGKPYKTSRGKMLYNPTLKREIPEGWMVSTLTSWIKSDKTGDWGKESPEGNYTLQVDCIRGADINGINGNGKINTPNRFILQKNEHKLLEPFDLVIEISGGSPTQSTGRMAFITDEVLERFSHPIICSNFCKAVSLHDNDLFYFFAYLWNSLYNNGVLFGWEGKTSGIKNFLFDAFVNKYHIPLPPMHLAKQFFEFAAPLERKKQTLLKENAKLEVLRDWLLPMLMNGQVTVK